LNDKLDISIKCITLYFIINTLLNIHIHIYYIFIISIVEDVQDNLGKWDKNLQHVSWKNTASIYRIS
jgi:hypothetical protein